jgi:hypothetical protein
VLRDTARPFPASGADNGPSDPTPVPMCRAPDGTDQLQCYCAVGLCGAGMLDAAAAVQSVARVAPQEAARQLLDYAESAYAGLFPGHPATQQLAPFHYRYYAATNTYLGVAVQSDSQYVLNGVYGLGGPFGSQITFLGMVTDFIAPSLAAATAGGRAR